MQITDIEIFHVNAGWRPWSFIKISTNSELVGWSECTDSHGSPQGISGVVMDLKPLLIGRDPRDIVKLCWEMFARTRQSPGSIIQKAIGGIENALWDIKSKSLGVPVYELFGGSVRKSIPLYWSHCGTSRVRAWKDIQKPQISSYDDLKIFGKEIQESGFKALKTNIAILDDDPYIYMPGFFKSSGGPELNVDHNLLSKIGMWVGGLRDSVGDEIDIAIDLNFNFKTEGYIKVAQMLEQYNLMWLEIDSYNPDALRHLRDSVSTPITSCENLYGLRQYRPYFEKNAMDIASIDVIWNGFSESKKIADFAELYEMNICPHNYNGHLSTFISMQLCSIVPNLRLAEIDVDDVPWRDELFTNKPIIHNGCFELSSEPGWGTDLNESALEKYKWQK
jgi:galactonate dehydratase